MNIRTLITALCLIATPPVIAAHISAFDTDTIYDLEGMANVTGSTGKWVHSVSASDFSEVSDTRVAAGEERIIFNTYVMAESNNATLSLDFGPNRVANLAGNDLAIFTLDPLTTPDLNILEPTVLDITIGGISRTYSSSPIMFGSTLEGVFNSDSQLIGALGVILVDLEPFLSDGALLGEFKINALTADENPAHYATITAAGAFNTTVVPLPLPIVLFGSGLALLGYAGRRGRR